MPRTWRRLGAVLIVIALLAGCSSKKSDLQNLKGVMAEYTTAAQALTWPADRPFPPAEQAYAAALRGEPESYQVGYGIVGAGDRWLCAWKSELLDAAKTRDQATVKKSLAMLATAPTLDAWQYFDAGTQESETDQLAKAKLKDYTAVAQYVEANC